MLPAAVVLGGVVLVGEVSGMGAVVLSEKKKEQFPLFLD